MPKAAVHENYLPESAEYNVRRTREITPVQPIAVAHTMQKSAHHKLGLGILAADATHALATCRQSEGVGHAPLYTLPWGGGPAVRSRATVRSSGANSLAIREKSIKCQTTISA